MSKGFGKVVLISSILAGAAVGSLAILKKEGIIGGENSVAKDLADKVSNKVSSDAADIIAKERNYVDLNSADEDADEAESADAEKAESTDASESESTDADGADFEPGIKAKNIEAANESIIGSSSSEEFFNDEE